MVLIGDHYGKFFQPYRIFILSGFSNRFLDNEVILTLFMWSSM